MSVQIPTSFRYPKKTCQSDPRVTKSLPKWCPKPSPGHLKVNLLLNCKSNENHCIYYVLNTSRRRYPLTNHKKNNSRIRTAISWSILRQSRQNDSKVGAKGLPKSIKNLLKSRSGPQGVLLGVLGDLRIIKMLPRGTQMHPQDTKMTNYSIRVGGMRRQPGKFRI